MGLNSAVKWGSVRDVGFSVGLRLFGPEITSLKNLTLYFLYSAQHHFLSFSSRGSQQLCSWDAHSNFKSLEVSREDTS